ncbi:hypothetical protein R8Z50_25645 [Longispora sp. K20-0274]|uniref:hypothetical protein n=1 Tax=Longispora sp. K20-0274 TaxID=3088255 RepID=UPI003999867B
MTPPPGDPARPARPPAQRDPAPGPPSRAGHPAPGPPGPVPRCAHPACFDRGVERGRYTRRQVEAFDAVQLGRVQVFRCPTFPGLFHTRARPGWRI